MVKSWLNKDTNKSCILFFNGWGMDKNAVNHLDSTHFDICMMNNYTALPPLIIELKAYESIYLVAWSLGVWASALVLSQANVRLTKSIALNGTQQPIHHQNGISPEVFDATLNNWDEKKRTKFNMRMFGGRNEFFQQNARISSRKIDDQKNELLSIKNAVESSDFAEIKFDCSLIGSSDSIFLPENQLKYWDTKTRIIQNNTPHYPFKNFKSWTEIINL